MKNLIVPALFLLGIIAVFSCKKKHNDPDPIENNQNPFYCVQKYVLEIKSPEYIEDTYVFGYNGGNSASFGSENELAVGSWRAAENVNGTFYDNVIYLKFDYALIPSEAIVDGAAIILSVDTFGYNSVPKYTPYGHSVDDDTKSIRISNVTSAWTESSLNYFNQPTESSLNAAMYPITKNAFQEYTFNVTALVKDQLDKGNNGFKIALTNPSGHNLLRFASSENAYATLCPKMILTYENANSYKNSK